jgi:dethiobiotin synthetase
MNMRTFITSTGTSIGKSFMTAALARQARALGRSVTAYKPLISGFDPAHIEDSDTGLLLQSMDMPPTRENIERVSPWRFTAPLAPSMAAKLEQREVDFDELVSHSRSAIKGKEDIVLIEGVGGVMVPITDRHTVLDWIAALDIQAILVAGSYLGTISHTLTALTALKQKKISVQSIVVNESEGSTVSLPDTIEELRHWTELPIIGITRRSDSDYRDVKELQSLLAFKEAA